MTVTTPILLSIQIGRPKTFYNTSRDGHPEQWRSAIIKSPIPGPVVVNETGLAGDDQADRQHHGGIDKAVLAYAAAHYGLWREERPEQDWQFGGFGENLTIEGLDEAVVCLGDVYRIGDVLLEVSQPRQPCWKLCRIRRQPDLAKRVVNTGRSGWYLRVLQPGTLAAGQPVALTERPLPAWTVQRAHRQMYGQRDDHSALEELASLPQVALAWREDLISRRLV